MGTIISDCGCCTIFTVRSCCDTDVTPPSQLTLEIGVGLRGANSPAEIFDNDPLSCSGSLNAKACGEGAIWRIPMTQVSPPTNTPYAYCWVNGVTDYFGGHYPEQPAFTSSSGAAFYPDAQGYCSVANPIAGCSAPYCCTPTDVFGTLTWDCANCNTLTIGNNMGVAAFVAACDPNLGGNELLILLYFLDLDTPHVATCDCLATQCGQTHLGGYTGAIQFGPAAGAYTCSNPMALCGQSNVDTGGNENTFTMSSACGTCYGQEVDVPSGGKTWQRDHVDYQLSYDYFRLFGGSGQCAVESTLGTGVCTGQLFDNSYTLTITGDIPVINGSYPLAFVTTGGGSIGLLSYTTGCTGFLRCTYSSNQPILYPIGFSFGIVANGLSWTWGLNWSLSGGAGFFGTSLADSYNCHPLVASGSFTVPGDPFAVSGQDCSECGCPTGGTVHWSVS